MRKTTSRLAGLVVLVGLLLAPATALAQQTTLTVAPRAGPVGTAFTVTGTGFAPNSRFFVEIRHVGSNSATGSATVTTGPLGGFSLSYDSVGDPLGTYRVSATLVGGTGQATATATFELTAATGQATMPRAGGGGSVADGRGAVLLVTGLGLLLLSGLATSDGRRRRGTEQ